MSGKSVLITGAAGFISSHLAERCLSLGWRVTALDSFTDYYAAPLKRQNIAFADYRECALIEDDYPRSTVAQSSRTCRSSFTWRLSLE